MSSTGIWGVVAKLDRFIPDQSGKKNYKGMKLSRKIEGGDTSWFLTATDNTTQPAQKITLKLSLAEMAFVGARATAEAQTAIIIDDYKSKESE